MCSETAKGVPWVPEPLKKFRFSFFFYFLLRLWCPGYEGGGGSGRRIPLKFSCGNNFRTTAVTILKHVKEYQAEICAIWNLLSTEPAPARRSLNPCILYWILTLYKYYKMKWNEMRRPLHLLRFGVCVTQSHSPKVLYGRLLFFSEYLAF